MCVLLAALDVSGLTYKGGIIGKKVHTGFWVCMTLFVCIASAHGSDLLQLQAQHGDFDPARHPRGFVDPSAKLVIPER